MPMTPEHKEAIRLGREAAKTNKQDKFVTKEAFDQKFTSLENSLASIVDILSKPNVPAEVAKQAVETQKVDEASHDTGDTNPRYDAKAKEILGEKVERTFVKYPKGGGTLFTVVIKKEFSNAPKDYLERMKEDQRTVNIEREEFRGEDGVEAWAKLIKANLGRTLR